MPRLAGLSSLVPCLRTASLLIYHAFGVWLVLTIGGCSCRRSTTPPSEARPHQPVNLAMLLQLRPEKSAVGVITSGGKWPKHRDYLETILAAVRQKYEGSITNPSALLSGRVSVSCRLLASGAVTDFFIQPDHLPSHLVEPCVRSVRDAAPFPAWTADMVSHLGETQDITITFNVGSSGTPRHVGAATGTAQNSAHSR